MVEYVSMTPAQARALLSTFLENTPGRVAGLREVCAASGGPSPEALDLGADSLDPLWAWAVPRLAWRDGYVPPPLDMPGPRHPAGPLEPEDQLPEWFDPRVLDGWRLSASTLWLVDGLARYLAGCVLAGTPSARWTVHRSRRDDALQNHLVVDGLPVGDVVEPMWSVTVLVTRALATGGPHTRGPRTLRALHDLWTGATRI